MYKTSVTYEDFEGNQKTKELYFNLTKAEITELQLSEEGGLDKKLQRIIEGQNPAEIVSLFKKFILLSYGERTSDGEFIKTSEKASAFASSEAYSELFMRLLSDEKEQEAFLYGIMPKDIAAAAKQQATSGSIASIGQFKTE